MDDAQLPLSEREREVLALVATGLSNQEIARELVISVNTVKVHMRSIFEKLGVQSRTEATLVAIRMGLVTIPGTEVTLMHPLPAVEERPRERVAVLPVVRPVTLWQRLFALVAILLVIVLVVLPATEAGRPEVEIANPVSDRPETSASLLTAFTSRWVEHADLPLARTRLGLAAYGGALYAIGGHSEDGVTAQVDMYIPGRDTWIPRARKLTPVSNIGAIAIGDLIYVPGGCDASEAALDKLEVYNPKTDTWTEAASLPVAVCGYALATSNERLYVIGGWDGTRFVPTVQEYDSAQDTWILRTELPYALGFAVAGMIGDTIYVAGGYDGTREIAETLAYDPQRDRWSPRTPMKVGRAGAGGAVVGAELYVIGGGWLGSVVTNEKYNPETDTWSPFETPVLGQWRNLGVAALDAEVYAVGGWNGSYMRINRSYRALFRIILPVIQ
ncbi:MAG: LuxR C-terminal-related transcriptional regulator [Anaerolineae bacterium]|nr:LuxR C-terminal-related transcriptional regulator [Anaerolineae bacterium]